MKKPFPCLALAAIITSSFTPAWAATRTVTLSVPGMNCPACPITVKKALTQVDGVTKTEVRQDRNKTVVTFDDAKTNVEKLTDATEDSGYPSSVIYSEIDPGTFS